ncbi:hypothetical protein BC940DRAFT_333169 [Gongronella butleri]|nr:hypothetical protein BC940DRAFT_333169 [Gongronella butleri]
MSKANRIYTAVYSGTPVFEMLVDDVAIMRRRTDAYMNATQILKIANLDKGRRTKVLEKEILTGVYEKVQGGYGKFQGTWIPMKTSIELAQRYHVYEKIRPMIEFDPEQAGNLEEKPFYGKDEYRQPRKKRDNGGPSASPSKKQRILPPPNLAPSPNDNPADGPNRTLLMSIFLSDDTSNVGDILRQAHNLNIDMVLDEQGNTALHWAASLARVETIEQLIAHHANVSQRNYAGETPLMRTVAATNSFDRDCFRKIVKILEPSLPTRDKNQRTILHHTSLTAGIHGRVNAALYYMHHLLHTIQSSPDPKALLDAQDDQGDTALNMAARLHCDRMIELLATAGANPDIENNLGLSSKAYSSGETDTSSITQSLGHSMEPMVIDQDAASTSSANAPAGAADAASATSAQPTEKRPVLTSPSQRGKEIVATVQKIVDALDQEYGGMLQEREQQLKDVQETLDKTNLELESTRKDLEKRQEESQLLAEGQQKVRNLQQALDASWADLEALLRKNNEVLDKQVVLGFDVDKDIDAELDAPQPSADEDKEKYMMQLKARVLAYTVNNDTLQTYLDELRAETAEKELQCKRLIAACCNLPMDKIDDLVEPLTLAIESDPPDLDLARVIGFMEKIRRQGAFPEGHPPPSATATSALSSAADATSTPPPPQMTTTQHTNAGPPSSASAASSSPPKSGANGPSTPRSSAAMAAAASTTMPTSVTSPAMSHIRGSSVLTPPPQSTQQ